MPFRCLCLLLLMCAAAGVARADEAADIQRLLRAGDAVAALQRAERWAAAQPRNASLRFLQGVALMDLRRDGEALAVFSAMTQDFPELPEPYNNLALLHGRAGHLDAARQALETALRNDPSNTTARRNLGEVHLRLAVQAWEQAASATPADAALLQRLRQARELAAAAR